MADPTITRQVLQVEHVKIETSKKFADVEAALERSVPQLDPAIGEALATGDEQRATELERGAPLFIFLKRDHGAGRSAKTRLRKTAARRIVLRQADSIGRNQQFNVFNF